VKIRRLLLESVLLFFLAAGGAYALEEKSLLTAGGTLYTVRAGLPGDLGLSSEVTDAGNYVIQWTMLRQDGAAHAGLVPATDDPSIKSNLELAYDEMSGSLVLLWKQQISPLDYLHLAILRGGVWTQADLLPNLGFFRAYNPQLLLSHQVVSYVNFDGNPVTITRSILSVIWWEESQYAQARFAPIFLDEDTSASDVQVYDLPALVGGGGPAALANHPAGSYMYPALQLEGIGGAILASFSDLASNKQYVARITYPDNLGKIGPDNLTWLRRRIPVVGVVSDGPIPDDVPVIISSVKTIVGGSYYPTLVWNTDKTVAYTHFDGKAWSSAAIPLTDAMTYDRALRLVQDMATRN
jgi:hypothetical protein